jgi:hypothetical protein
LAKSSTMTLLCSGVYTLNVSALILVTSCAASFKAKNAEDINLLKDLVERASKKTPEALELEEINDTVNDLNKQETSGNHGSAEEKKMYDPLVRNTLSECLPSP